MQFSRFNLIAPRLDVNTKWLLEYGTRSAKDYFTVEEVQHRENSEEPVGLYWTQSKQIADKVFR
jgi:hypothetical protein